MANSNDLAGHVSLITGGARGIGLAAAVALAKRGAKIHLADILDCDDAVAEVEQAGGVAGAHVGKPFVVREFLEIGVAQKMGYCSPEHMIKQFPSFFDEHVEPMIGPALAHLKQTPEGKEVIAQLYSRVKEASRH